MIQSNPSDVRSFAASAGRTLLEELVSIEFPSTDKEAVDRLGKRIIQELAETGAEIEIIPSETAGNRIRPAGEPAPKAS